MKRLCYATVTLHVIRNNYNLSKLPRDRKDMGRATKRELHDNKKGRPLKVDLILNYIYLLSAVAKDAQQEQEEVDEIEVECKCTHKREFLTSLTRISML